MQGMKGLALLVLVSLGALLLAVVSAVVAEGATITVPDDYPTIQSAIENATDYDTVMIAEGVYEETVVVWRPLNIIGEDPGSTIIQGGDPFGLLVAANKVNVSDLTVRMSDVGAGLILQASYCRIENVNVRDSLWGLWVNRGYHNLIWNVECVNNSWQGLVVEEADHNVFEFVACFGNTEGAVLRAAIDNTFISCDFISNGNRGLVVERREDAYANKGLVLRECNALGNTGSGLDIQYIDGVKVENCTVENNGYHGINLYQCDDVTVRGCTVRFNANLGIGNSGAYVSHGCVIEGCYVESDGTSSKVMVRRVEDSRILGNTVRCTSAGISVYEANHTLVENNTLVGTGDDPTALTRGITISRPPGGTGLPPHDVTLRGNVVGGFHDGIWTRGVRDLVISGCTVTDCANGILCQYQTTWGDVPFDGGEISDCLFEGCGLDIQGMEGVTVRDNTISGAEIGIHVNATEAMVDGNLFTANVIRDCTAYGVLFNSTNGSNLFHYNTFINNTVHCSDPSSRDDFDDGKYGNYWDDYEERYPDASVDGVVWNTHYAVNGSPVKDKKPLAYPYDDTDPVADAGEDQVVEAGETVTLDGTGSTDDHGILNYTWYVERLGGAPEVLYGPTAALAVIYIGAYEVQLTVKDAWGHIGTDTIYVHVEDHEAPTAAAGGDVDVGMGEELVLDGTASSDNGIIVAYKWTVELDGIEQVLEGAIVTLRIEWPGEYLVTLSVRDEADNTGVDTLTVRVIDTEPPVADPGEDLTVDQGVSVALDGSRSTDNIGVVSWRWTIFDWEEQVDLEGEEVSYTFQNWGTWPVGLNVTDAAGNWDEMWINVTVRDAVPPLAAAGVDIETTVGTPVHFDGSSSNDNVRIVTYTWTFAVEGERVTLTGEEPFYAFDTPGTYLVTLWVEDGAGNVGTDDLKVTVRDVETERQWSLGPFKDANGPLGGVRVEAVFNGTSIVAYTDDGGTATFTVPLEDLTSPVSVSATKAGWEDLDFDVTLDASGDPTGTLPVMQGKAMDGGDGEDEDEDWLPWVLVVVLIIAYAGTLLYLSSVAKREGGE